VTAKGNPRAVLATMEDLLREGIITVNKNTGELTVLKELSENNLNVSTSTSIKLQFYTSLVVTVVLISASSVAAQYWPIKHALTRSELCVL
jgi:hypothetical protein